MFVPEEVARGPSGREYATAWALEGPLALYIPEAHPDNAQANWTVPLDLDSTLVPPFSVRFQICARVVFRPATPACHALFGFQNST